MDTGDDAASATPPRARLPAGGRPGLPIGPGRPRTRKRSLSVEAIVAATMRIIDTEGIDEVSMRRVASEFDTGPASLYAHVTSKDELLGLALYRFLEELPLPVGDTWQDVVRSWAHTTRDAYQRHNDIARLTFGTVAEGPRVRDIAERLLGSMISGGVPPQVATWTLDTMSLYVAADAYEGWLMSRLFDDGSGRPPWEVGRDYFMGFGERIRALSPEQYPNLTGHVEEMLNGDGDDRFSFAIDMFIAGIAAQVRT